MTAHKDGNESGAKGGNADNAPQRTQIAAAGDLLTSVGEVFKAWAAKNPDAATSLADAVSALGPQARPRRAAASGPKRAICLGGGGPAVGLHIGALEALEKNGKHFGDERSVWALSCIGAWAGVIYNQADEIDEKGKIERTYKFFRDVFRDDESFRSFPTNTIFAPDWAGYAEAAWNFLLEPQHYRNAFLPGHIMESWRETLSILRDRKNWRTFGRGDFNRWTLNNLLAVHPGVRFLTALMYKSAIDGRARLYYEDSKFLQDIKFDRLNEEGKPYIFHNAFNFDRHDIDIFSNHSPSWHDKTDHKPISPASLCACSALPYVEQSVKVDGKNYCEGALVDTVNFKTLLTEHNDVEEIWINRIVDVHQIRKPDNIYDALANLCEMFAATVGEDDVKLFKLHVRENNRLSDKDAEARKVPKWKGTIIEIQVDDHIDFHWSRKNLEDARRNGARAAANAYKLYDKYKNKPPKDGVLIIPDDLSDDEILKAGVNKDELPLKRKREPDGTSP